MGHTMTKMDTKQSQRQKIPSKYTQNCHKQLSNYQIVTHKKEKCTQNHPEETKKLLHIDKI